MVSCGGFSLISVLQVVVGDLMTTKCVIFLKKKLQAILQAIAPPIVYASWVQIIIIHDCWRV